MSFRSLQLSYLSEEEQVLLSAPGIQIQDFSLEENTQLFEKLSTGFGKLGVVTTMFTPTQPLTLPWDIRMFSAQPCESVGPVHVLVVRASVSIFKAWTNTYIFVTLMNACTKSLICVVFILFASQMGNQICKRIFFCGTV